MAIIRRENRVRSNLCGEENEEQRLGEENNPEARDEEWTKKEDRMSESRERWCRKDKLRQGSTYSLLNHRIQHQESCWRTRHDQKKDIGAAKGESPVTLQYDRELLLESYFLTKDRKRSAGKDDQSSQTGKATIRISGSDDCQWWSSDELDNSSGSMHR